MSPERFLRSSNYFDFLWRNPTQSKEATAALLFPEVQVNKTPSVVPAASYPAEEEHRDGTDTAQPN